MNLRERAWERAGLSDLVTRRLRGEALSPREIERVRGADLLALGSAADEVRRVECGDEVRVYCAGPPPGGPLVRVVDASETRRGTELLRGLALDRLAAPPGTRFCWDYSALGLELGQVVLAFGVSDWTGPARRGGALPLAGDPKHLPSRRDELAGYIARAGRRAVFVDAAPAAPAAPASPPRKASAMNGPLLLLAFPEELSPIAEKVARGERLTAEDGMTLFEHPDYVAVGQLAHAVRTRRHGDLAFFNKNMRIEVTNVCKASCLFCSFAKLEEGAPGSHTMKLEEAWRELEVRMADPPDEIHIVNGLHPGLPFSYYEDLLRGFKRIKPDVHLKCFTAVEIHFFAEHYGMSNEEVLTKLRAAGLDSLPGGGAEIFHPEVRTRISGDKADAEQYLEVHRVAHRMGMRTNVTMLYGHIETFAHRVDHLLRLRALQDETGGLQAFIPLAFHPDGNGMRHLPGPTGVDDLRTIAVSRLMLDNVEHIKAYWVSSTPKVAQVALRFGADDVDGTIVHETIYHAAGSTSPQGLTQDGLLRMIREAGMRPVLRDTLYNRLREYPKAALPEASVKVRDRKASRHLEVLP